MQCHGLVPEVAQEPGLAVPVWSRARGCCSVVPTPDIGVFSRSS